MHLALLAALACLLGAISTLAMWDAVRMDMLHRPGQLPASGLRESRDCCAACSRASSDGSASSFWRWLL